MARATGANAAASTDPKAIETLHEDMIHDAQLDFYGRRLATCSSDRTIKVFDVVDGAAAGQGETLRGHEGPVWQVAWAHPKFGSILASCSYDGKVIIWKDEGGASTNASSQGPYGARGGYGTQSGWQKIKEHAMHTASVNSIAWAPHELGAILACASSDGNISVLSFNNDGTWAVDMVAAHPIGCNAVSWAPAAVPGSLIAAQQPAGPGAQGAASPLPSVRRFASAGCDNSVKLWEFNQEQNRWVDIEQLVGHSDWVRDVAFAPNIGLPRSHLATASQDRTVLIWTQDTLTSPWTKVALNPTSGSAPQGAASTGGDTPTSAGKFPDTVWRVSWSVSGNVLAVSCGDGKITLWKENLKGGWECISEMDS
ncbi:WD40 repeat-like protein [Tilletiaria anomala UBC 951]|uniref:WD40 repeat-like protein n=1 Tax=Tilletiaria anomala (strain ATCC 24038 / CBS 436.72 / UBC 951) TaxID=1037660 RepID=A0A066V5Q2_TILAU|nr:WD40 repeat-like protein [Tilletiaria anomala UBC 951]KDN35578.1 WD40 repeat-like protein [Tilletiaria anomala UBC 951]